MFTAQVLLICVIFLDNETDRMHPNDVNLCQRWRENFTRYSHSTAIEETLEDLPGITLLCRLKHIGTSLICMTVGYFEGHKYLNTQRFYKLSHLDIGESTEMCITEAFPLKRHNLK